MSVRSIAVCIKSVPADPDVALDRIATRIAREEVKGTMNPDDRHAVELALQLKAQSGATRVVVVSMGPESAREVLKEALAMGADEAVLVSDPALVASDAVATATVLARALEKSGPHEVVMLGTRSLEGQTGAVPAMVAEWLERPLGSRIKDARLEGEALAIACIDAEGAFAARIALPCVLSVGREAPKPRLATAMGVMKAGRKPFTQLALADLGVESGSVGKAGALARLVAVTAAERQRKGKAIDASRPDVLREVMGKLSARGLL